MNAARMLPVVETMETRLLFSVAGLPHYDHVVIVVEENHSYGQIMTDTPSQEWAVVPQPLFNEDPYIRRLGMLGASFTNSHAITHPSYPNYLALFSGSTHGITADSTPRQPFAGPDLGGELLAAGLSFAGYSENLPRPGYSGGNVGPFLRTHVPWPDFTDVPAADDLPFSRFPRNYNLLPTVSFVVPNIYDDMHSESVNSADRWLQSNLSGYAGWSLHHNSLLIVTWDESAGDSSNRIPTIFFGQHVRHIQSNEPIDHYSILRTVEDIYDLPYAGESAAAAPITDVFK